MTEGIGLYINLIFYIPFLLCLIVGGLIGLIRGLRKSVFSLISYIIMAVVFMIISIPIASLLYGMDISGYLPSDLSSCKTVSDIAIQSVGELDPSIINNEVIVQTINQLCLCFIRYVVFVILLFVGYFIWSFIAWILWMTIFRGKKEQRLERKKRHLLGGAVGLCKGFVTFVVLFIPCSGFFSMISPGLEIYQDYTLSQPEASAQNEGTTLFDSVSETDEMNEDSMELIMNVASELDKNIAIKIGTALGNPFFDNIMSFKMGKGKSKSTVAVRKEVVNLINLGIYSFDNVITTNSDGVSEFNITETTVNKVFDYIGNSNLLGSGIPIAIEYVLQMDMVEEKIGVMGTDYDLKSSDLYDINWKKELNGYGTVAGDLVTIVSDLSDYQTEDGNYDILSILNNCDDKKVASAFTALSNLESITTVMPIGIDFILKQDVEHNFVPEDFTFDYGEQKPSEWWSSEIENLGTVFTKFKDLEIEEIPMVEDSQSIDVAALLGIITEDEDRLETFVGSVVESRLVTKVLPIGFDMGMDMVSSSLGDDVSCENLFNYTNMTKEQWKADFVSLIYAAEGLYNSKLMDISSSGISYSELNYDSLDTCVTKVLTLNLVEGNQGKIFNMLLNMIESDSLPINVEDIDFEAVDNWGNEGSALVNTFKEASVILDNMDGLSIETLNTEALDKTIDKATDSKIAIQIIPNVLESVLSGMNINELLGVEGDYQLPVVTNWKSEGKALVSILEGIKGKEDITMAVIKLDPDKILDSYIVTDLAVKALSSLDNRDGMNMLVIPYDETSEKWYDTEDDSGELRKVLNAIQLLAGDAESIGDLSSSISIGTIIDMEESDIDTLFNSDILYETSISMFESTIDGNDMIVVPSTARVDGKISKTELTTLLKESKALGIVSVDEVTGEEKITADATLINKITSETLESKILYTTISKVLLDTSELIIPVTVNAVEGDKDAIAKAEVLALSNAFTSLEIVDVDGNINASIDMIERLNLVDLDSEILHATISNKIEENESLIKPNEVYVTTLDTDNLYIDKDEIIYMKNAVNELGLIKDGNLDNASINASLITKVGNNTVSSLILRSTISQQIYDAQTEELVIPDSVYDTNVTISIDKYALKDSEILGLKTALDEEHLNLIDGNSIDASKLNPSLINLLANDDFDWDNTIGKESEISDENYSGSRIIHHSMSKMISDQLTDITLLAYYDYDVRNTITITELKALTKSIDMLGLVETVGETSTVKNPELSCILDTSEYSIEQLNTLFSSVILHEQISNKIFSDESFTAPLVETTCNVEVASGYNGTEDITANYVFILTNEYKQLAKAIKDLGLIEENSFINVDASIIYKFKDNDALIDSVLESYIIRYAFSEMLLEEENLDCPASIFNPDSNVTGDDFSRVDLVTNVEYKFIQNKELKNVINAVNDLDLLVDNGGTTSIALVSNDDVISDEVKYPNELITKILSEEDGSLIVQAYFSDLVISETGDGKKLHITTDLYNGTTKLYLDSNSDIKSSNINLVAKTDLLDLILQARELKSSGITYNNFTFEELKGKDGSLISDTILVSKILTVSMSKIIDSSFEGQKFNGVSFVKAYDDKYAPMFDNYADASRFWQTDKELESILTVATTYQDYEYISTEQNDVKTPLNAINESSILRPSLGDIVEDMMKDGLIKAKLLNASDEYTLGAIETKDAWTEEIIKIQTICNSITTITTDNGFIASGITGIDFTVGKEEDNSDTPSQLGILLDTMASSTYFNTGSDSLFNTVYTNFSSLVPIPEDPDKSYSERIETYREQQSLL